MRDEVVKLLENEDFVKKIIITEDVKEVKKLFKENGVEVSDSELDEMGSIISDIIEILNKIPEEELKSVSGGETEMRSGNIWGANLIRRIAGYEPARYSDDVMSIKVEDDENKNSWFKSFPFFGSKNEVKEIGIVHQTSKGKDADSNLKNFIGKNANEIALGSMVAASTAMFIGSVYGVQRLVIWYKNRH